jgi:hypothetical protein
MVIPNSFTDAISLAFYDKTFTVYSTEESKDDYGWTTRDLLVSTGTFKGNITFSQLDRIQEQYGLEEVIDALVTTSYSPADYAIVSYNGRYYKVIRKLPFDSHNKLVLQKWQPKSGESPSS